MYCRRRGLHAQPCRAAAGLCGNAQASRASRSQELELVSEVLLSFRAYDLDVALALHLHMRMTVPDCTDCTAAEKVPRHQGKGKGRRPAVCVFKFSTTPHRVGIL